MTRVITFLNRPIISILNNQRNALQIQLRNYSVKSFESSVSRLNKSAQEFVLEKARICQPDKIHVCDGSKKENDAIIKQLVDEGVMHPLHKMENCYVVRTDPADVARVESKTFVSTPNRGDTIPTTKEGCIGQLGNWISPDDLKTELGKRFPGCMKGRTMYVLPFSMGPLGGALSKIGIQVTDSLYVAASMNIMTRMGASVLDVLGSSSDYVKCLHSVGQPLPTKKKVVNHWPCNPEQTMIAHLPDKSEISSFGSGYGGNSLLGKKCLALRLGSYMAHKEGWLAEHMLILGITNPKGVKKYIAAAFPSACGKTNLAMMQPTLPGYKVECVGDDIAWMKFDSKGQLRAINPEAGFFGVAPGTSMATNPQAMRTIQRNTVFTNVATTSDGRVYWEGLEHEVKLDGLKVTDWHGNDWTRDSKGPSSHPNSRFCTPASQCPNIDPLWESPDGVPIEAIIFGGRRPRGVPLVYEAFSWGHGVFLGAAMRSESTAAAEHKAKVIMHDPFAMRPFFGYNFGHYLQHWLSFKDGTTNGFDHHGGHQLPRIFHVNWFRKDQTGGGGGFLWPGFGENSRVLDWIFRRLDGEQCAVESPIGFLPKDGSINLAGMPDGENVDMRQLFSIPGDFWRQEVVAIEKYFDEQLGKDLPPQVHNDLRLLGERVAKL